MKREVELYVRDILGAIADIEEFTTGLDEHAFYEDKKTQYAVVRSFEIIGEAAKHIPLNLRYVTMHVPWADMAGMRDIMIHEYFGINVAIVWKTIKDDLPPLKKDIKEILDAL